jgi:hypothetical protein
MVECIVRELRPTAHCIYVTSDALHNSLKYMAKLAWLFFDQTNNNAKLARLRPLQGALSTDLSTVFVDKEGSRCQTKTYVTWAWILAAYWPRVHLERQEILSTAAHPHMMRGPQVVGIEF